MLWANAAAAERINLVIWHMNPVSALWILAYLFFFPWEISQSDGSLADTKELSSAGVWSDYREESHGYNCWDEEFTSSGGSGRDPLVICICSRHRHIILASVQAGVVSKVDNIVLCLARGPVSALFFLQIMLRIPLCFAVIVLIIFPRRDTNNQGNICLPAWRRYRGILNLPLLLRCTDSSILVGQIVVGALPCLTCSGFVIKSVHFPRFCELKTTSPHLFMWSSRFFSWIKFGSFSSAE